MNGFGESLSQFATPDVVRACMALALVGVSVVVGLLARPGRQGFFHLWAIAWLFYAVCLAAQFAWGVLKLDQYSAMVPTICVAESALFFLCGNLEMVDVQVDRRLVAVLAFAIFGAVYGAYRVGVEAWVIATVFSVLAGAAAFGGFLYLRNMRGRRRLTLVAGGLMFWAVPVVVTPMFEASRTLAATGYVAVAAFALLVVLGMIIERETEAADQKYRSVLDGLNEAVLMVDLWTLKVLDVNQVAARFARQDVATLVGMNFLDLCPDLRKEGENVLDHRKMFATVFKPHNEFHFARADGTMLLCEGETSMVRWHQRPVMQVRVREGGVSQNVGQMVRRAEKMSSLGQLIAGVAHELNNPLAVVVAASQILEKRGIEDPVVKDHIGRILHESERAAKIVRDLLSFARPMEPQMQAVDVNQLVKQVLDIRQRDFEDQKIEVKRRLRLELARTKADPIQIEQVLNNLVTNAIHAMQQHTGKRQLSVATEESAHFIRITVTDNGCGIPPDVMARIFDPFYTTKPAGRGTGLGLSISHSIMAEHHGRIWAESEVGKGTVFYLEFPIVPVEAPSAGKAPVEVPSAPVPAATKQEHYRLLIVDDEPGIREVLEAILSGDGYDVKTAGNGTEALEQVRNREFDLILSDLMMPGMDGEQFYDILQREKPAMAKRIVFVTGDTVSLKSRTFLERTGCRWLSKPFNIRDVEEVVSRQLDELGTKGKWQVR